MPIEQLYPDIYEGEEVTLKPFAFTDGRKFADAANPTFEGLREWFKWAVPGMHPGEGEAICEQFEFDYADGKDWNFGVWRFDDLIGGAAFHPTDKEFHVTADLWITRPLTFKGHATHTLEAMLEWGFRQWSFDVVTLYAPTDVPAAARVAEKVGLVQVGIEPGAVKDVHGTPRDAVVFRVDKETWKASY